MKIGKYTIISGPNPQFYIATAFFAWWSLSAGTVWPIFGWFLFWVVMIPLSIKLHEWNQKREEEHRQYMLTNFPLDPEVQRKHANEETNGESSAVDHQRP